LLRECVMQCSFSDCWRWVALIAPTMILLWSYWEVRERFKYKPTLYDQERVRSSEHFYVNVVGENSEYDVLGSLKFEVDRDRNFVRNGVAIGMSVEHGDDTGPSNGFSASGS